MSLRVGDLVNDPKSRTRLCCGSGVYPHAVVMSIDPFIMVSERTDMLWTCQEIEGFVKVGRASRLTILRCTKRLTWKQRKDFVFGKADTCSQKKQ